jgi:protein-disulfide isomerase
MASRRKNGSFEKLVPVLVFMSVVLAFAVGVLWQKVSNLEGGETVKKPVAQAPDAQDPENLPPSRPTTGKLSEEQAGRVPKIGSEDHIRGNKNAKVFLIEYSDFECPFCARFHPTAQQVLDEYGDDVAWVYRHFPLDQLHPNARPAAEASECVAEIGGEEAFWEFADAIYEDQTKVSDAISVASSVGVSSSSLQTCIDSGKYEDLVEQMYQGGISSGVTGTPGNIIVNAKGEAWLVPGALPFEQIKTTIDEALSS